MQATNQLHGKGISGVETVQQGISLSYDVETVVEYGNNRVVTTIKKAPIINSGGSSVGSASVTVNPMLRSLGEGQLAMSSLVLRGADNVAYSLFGAIHSQNAQNGFVPFADIYAGRSKYSNGSRVSVNEYLLTMGLSYQQDRIKIAGLIETGWSDYTSKAYYANGISLRGSGDNRYYGIGVLWRYGLESGFYTDGSLRFGRTRTKYSTDDIVNIASGERVRYNLSSPYFGAHLSAGYIVDIDERNKIDLSTKFLWTSIKGKKTRVAGDPINFGRLNSKRLRVGAEWNHLYSDTTVFKVGLGYEYEFGWDTNIKTYQIYNVDALSLKGSTGILTLGTTMKPSANSRFSFDANVVGYVGKRKGGTANLRINYNF